MSEWAERTRLVDLDDYYVQSFEPTGTEGAIWVDTTTISAPVIKVFLSSVWRTTA